MTPIDWIGFSPIGSAHLNKLNGKFNLNKICKQTSEKIYNHNHIDVKNVENMHIRAMGMMNIEK